jgi:hypothetical protein
MEKALRGEISDSKGGVWPDLSSTANALWEAERALALAKGEETALACDWPAPWDVGAPMPYVVAGEGKTYLIYLIREAEPLLDGSSVTIVDPASYSKFPVALVEFLRCTAFRFGGPNDEVIHGHPLYGKGLNPYGAHIIANSRWLAELMEINSVHLLHNPSNWTDVKHYMLLFHDDMFECLARGFKVEVFRARFTQVLQIATERLVT